MTCIKSEERRGGGFAVFNVFRMFRVFSVQEKLPVVGELWVMLSGLSG